MKNRVDLESQQTTKSGLSGLFELVLRKFKIFTHLATMVPVYFLGALLLGLCLTPGVYLFRATNSWFQTDPLWVQNFMYGVALALGYVSYGVSLILVAPAANLLLGRRLKPFRGQYYSSETLKWYLHNALTYLPRYTFLEFLTPSPVALLFYRMMGMRIGKGTIINSTWISDPSLIEMGEKVTIGGSVTIVAHYGQGGMLIIAPVKIGSKVTVGLKATIMGDTEIGEGAKILPHSVVLPKTKIPPGETWGGVPARLIKMEDLRAIQAGA